MNNCCLPENKMAALNLQVYKCFSSSFKDYRLNLKETKNTQQEMLWKSFREVFNNNQIPI